jgi:nucleoside-diphosphate-sugar epimerase
VLVTGGTGFLGGYILKNLVEKSIAVRAIRRSSKTPFFIPETILEKVEWFEGDILDVVSLEEAMAGVGGVIHAAAFVSFYKKERNQMYKVNVEGTANVVNAAIEKNVSRFLHVSSVAAIGRKTKPELVAENKKWEENKSNTHYAISKHKAELEVWRGFAEGLHGAIINPSTILGFGDWHSSSCAIFKNAYKQFPWYTKGINGFVGVEDVAKAAVQLLLSDVDEKRFIISSENISFQELFNLIAQEFGKRKPHREATKALAAIAWRIEALKSFITQQKPLLTRETAMVSQNRTKFSNSAILQTLLNFSFTPLECAIKKACKNYLEALQAGVITL